MISRRFVALLLLQAFHSQAQLDNGAVYAKTGKTSANKKDQDATWRTSVAVAGLCITGKEQSPIDVVTKQVVRTTLPMITTHFDTVLSYVKNTGYGYQLFEMTPQSYRYDATSMVTKTKLLDTTPSAKGYSMIGGAKYNFYQINWHTPSENTVDGKHAVMEAPFVHQLAYAGDQSTQ